ncbi:MAG: large repetitive protein [Verrucomicrobiota bacterium]
MGLASTTFVRAETLVALTSGNRLLFFDSATPGTVTKTISISTAGSEALVAIDFRPATGDLYAMGASGRLYVLNLTTGETFVPPAPPATLSGTRFGFDFNPAVDLIRVVSDLDQNLRLNPTTGSLTATDTPLTYAAGDAHAGANPNVVGSAYTNNFVGAAATVLYDIDSTLDVLVIQNQPNAGILNTVGNLGVNTTDEVGFDISQGTGVAYASLTVGGSAGLYQISLANGAATLVGAIANAASLAGETVVDISVLTATRLLNISTRGRVGTGDDVLIGGFINRGGGRLVLRAIGPSLGAFGVPSPLPDPVLTLKDANGNTLATNDDWQSNQAADITATGLAPTNSLESAILTSLPAGNYSGIVSGKGSATGVALIEVYQL